MKNEDCERVKEEENVERQGITSLIIGKRSS